MNKLNLLIFWTLSLRFSNIKDASRTFLSLKNWHLLNIWYSNDCWRTQRAGFGLVVLVEKFNWNINKSLYCKCIDLLNGGIFQFPFFFLQLIFEDEEERNTPVLHPYAARSWTKRPNLCNKYFSPIPRYNILSSLRSFQLLCTYEDATVIVIEK